MTAEQIQAELEQILAESSWWKRFIGSQFVSYLSLFLAQLIERVTQSSERNLQESFLSHATKRTSILAGAEDRSYVGRKISPSRGTLALYNKSDSRIDVLQYSPLISDDQLQYMVMDAYPISAGQTVEVSIQQIKRVFTTVTIEESKNWQSIALSVDDTKITHKVIVRVNEELWESSFKFRNAEKDSKVYSEFYKSSDQIAIRFGNNVTGKALSAGDVVELEIWQTEGETTLIDGQKLKFIEDSEYLNKSLTATTLTSIVGGDEAEDIEDIRAGALYADNYDEQIAWDGDYKTFIRKNIGGLEFLNVWGEADQEKLTGIEDQSNVNGIFICTYSSTKGDSVNDEILALFDGREAYNERFHFAEREDLPFSVTITGVINANYSASEVGAELIRSLESKFGKDVESTSNNLSLNDLWHEVESLRSELGIERFELNVTGLERDAAINTYRYFDAYSSSATFTYS